jgi:hypothetical protein
MSNKVGYNDTNIVNTLEFCVNIQLYTPDDDPDMCSSTMLLAKELAEKNCHKRGISQANHFKKENARKPYGGTSVICSIEL